MEHENKELDQHNVPESESTQELQKAALSNVESTPSVDPVLARIRTRFGLGSGYLPQDTSAQTLLSRLNDPDWRIRTAVARRLGSAGHGEEAKSALLSLLLDPVPAVRAAAARALGDLDDEVPEQPLLLLMENDGDDDVRTAAVQALSVLDEHLSTDTIVRLQAAFNRPGVSDITRSAIIYALGGLGERTSIDLLSAAMRDRDWLVREAAALVMGEQKERADVEALEKLLDDEAEPVCKAAVHALGKIWEETSEQILDATPSITVKDQAGEDGQGGEGQSGSPSGSEAPPRFTQDAQPNEQQSRRRIQGDVEFYAYEPGELTGTIVVAQAFDNQWVPRSLLRAILNRKISINDAEKYLEGLVHTEYIRSLINSQRVVINRAFLYNNPALARDYLHPGASREAFKKLLDDQVIVPWLLYEMDPTQKPDFGVLPQSFPIWQQISKAVAMHCVRFSWDEETNAALQRSFSQDFHEFVQNLYVKDPRKFAVDLGLSQADADTLFQRLYEINELSRDYFVKHRSEPRPYITRNVLYERFITEGNTALRLYDASKPFAGEIKQLLDLFYNAHQADAFHGYLLTPIDSPTRLILQEWDPRRYRDKPLESGSLIDMLRGSAFALAQEGLYLRSMGLLTLQDVLDIRNTEEWQQYIVSLQALLENPHAFQSLAQRVYYDYFDLVQIMTHLIELRQQRQGGALKAPWEPTAKMQINIGAAKLEVIWNRDGTFHRIVNEELLSKVSTLDGSTPVSVRWTIGDSGAGSTSTQAKLFSSFEIMQGRLYNAQKEWQELIKALREGLLTKEFSVRQEEKVQVPTMNERLEQ